MRDARESAYRYDLFITPQWRDRFDTLFNENVELPLDGRILDVNCGTGAHAIEIAERLKEKGEVIGIDPSAERIELARAKAQVEKAERIEFEKGSATSLRFDDDSFDTVIGDASMLSTETAKAMLAEMVRVVKPGGRVVLKMTTHGSFDEFFSIYWEALHEV